MNGSSLKQVNLTHVMKIVCNEDNSLNEKIDKFWDLDTIGIKENETSVYGRFISDIKFNYSRCSQFPCHLKKIVQYYRTIANSV